MQESEGERSGETTYREKDDEARGGQHFGRVGGLSTEGWEERNAKERRKQEPGKEKLTQRRNKTVERGSVAFVDKGPEGEEKEFGNGTVERPRLSRKKKDAS